MVWREGMTDRNEARAEGVVQRQNRAIPGHGRRPGGWSGVPGGGGADRPGGPGRVVNLRRRHPDFRDPVAGTDVHPHLDRHAVVAWLLAHHKIEIPTGPTVASLVLAGTGSATHRFRLDDPWLTLAHDAEGEDVLSGWSTDTDADAPAELTVGTFGAPLRRLTAPGTKPLAVMGAVRVIDRFRSGSGGLRLTLAGVPRAPSPPGGAPQAGPARRSRSR